MLSYCVVIGNIPLALDLTNKLLEILPTHPRALGNKVYYEDELVKSASTAKRKGDDDTEEVTHNQGVNNIKIKVIEKLWPKIGVTPK